MSVTDDLPFLPEDDLLWRQLKTIPAFRAVLRAVESRFYYAVDLPAPVLDVGCGDGHFAQMTFDHNLDVGIDPWWNPLKKSYRAGAYDLLLQGMGDQMPFPDNYFASAFSNSVLEHIPDIQPVLNETGRVLQENGRFLITMPSQYFTQELGGALWLEKLNMPGLADRYRTFFNKIARHEHTDGPEVWARRLAQAGFVIERWQYYFSAEALHALELGHVQGLPSALLHLLTGTWIVAPWESSLKYTERWLRPFYEEEAEADHGTCLLIVARKKANGPVPFYLPPARPFSVAELAEVVDRGQFTVYSEQFAGDSEQFVGDGEQFAGDSETAVREMEPVEPDKVESEARDPKSRFDLIAVSLAGLTLLLALVGQISVSGDGADGGGGLSWFFLSFLALTLLAWRMGLITIRAPGGERPFFRPGMIPKRRWWLLLSFFLALIAYRQAASFLSPWPAWLTLALWAGGLGLAFYVLSDAGRPQPEAVAPAPGADRLNPHRSDTAISGWLLLAAGAVLLLIALAIRVVALGSHPWILNGVEASLGLDMQAIAHGAFTNPFATGWLSNPTLPLFLMALPVKLFGPSAVSLRLLSPLIGALTVTAVFYFGTRLWRVEVGLAAAVLLAGSHFHLHYSRLGLTNVWDGLLALLALGSVALAWQNGRRSSWLWAGLFTGLCAYTYTASHLLPLILIGLLTVAVIGARRRFQAQFSHIVAGALLALVAALPMLLHYHNQPGLFMERFNQLSLLSGQTDWLAQEAARTGESSGQIWQGQLSRTLLAFNATLDASPSYRPERPLLSNGLAVFFLLGVMLAVLRLREHKYVIALFWLLVPLIFGSALLLESPSSHRLVIALPIVCLLAGAALVELVQWLLASLPATAGRVDEWLLPVVLVVAALIALNESFFYFGPYRAAHTFADRNTEIAHEIAVYLNTLDSDTTTAYFFGPPNMYISFPTIPFLAPSFTANENLFDVVGGVEKAVYSPPNTDARTFILLPVRGGEIVSI